MQQHESQALPQQRAMHLAHQLQQTQHDCQRESSQVTDPKAQAIFETVAEVLGGVTKALIDYSLRTERAWAEAGSPVQLETSPPTVSDLAVDVDAATPPPRVSDLLPRQHGEEDAAHP